jgi:membrane associated rhomboid family serine protease
MLGSIAQDIRDTMSHGNMVMKLIIVNFLVFIVTALLEAFLPSTYHSHILPWIALPGDLTVFITRPWTLVTHMFVHGGIWHIAWNMIMLYWFGNITGDLLNDKRVLPIYFFGGLAGGLLYMASYQVLPYVGSMAIGASAAVLSVVFAAVLTAPEYRMHLLLLGEVRIKYIGLAILFLDLIGTSATADNSGGHIAHLGGSLFGLLFVYLLRKGTDLGSVFYKSEPRKAATGRARLRVAHKSESILKKQSEANEKTTDISKKVDQILEKIKKEGYDSLSDSEKEILYKASKS